MSVFKPGTLIIDNRGRIGLLIEYPTKRLFVGTVYKVLFEEGIEWVYPENIEVLKKLQQEKDE